MSKCQSVKVSKCQTIRLCLWLGLHFPLPGLSGFLWFFPWPFGIPSLAWSLCLTGATKPRNVVGSFKWFSSFKSSKSSKVKLSLVDFKVWNFHVTFKTTLLLAFALAFAFPPFPILAACYIRRSNLLDFNSTYEIQTNQVDKQTVVKVAQES